MEVPLVAAFASVAHPPRSDCIRVRSISFEPRQPGLPSLERAFVYEWREWRVQELHAGLLAAGFRRIFIYVSHDGTTPSVEDCLTLQEFENQKRSSSSWTWCDLVAIRT